MGYDFRENFSWGVTVAFLGHVVPEVNSMIHGEGPQSGIELSRPMNELMHHHGTGPSRDSLEATLGNSILVMGTDTTEGQLLVIQFDVGIEFLGSKWMVVAVVSFDLDSVQSSFFLKLMLALEGLGHIKGDLVMNANVGGGVVNKYGSASVPGSNGFSTFGVFQSSSCGAYVLIDGDTITGVKVAAANGHFIFWDHLHTDRSGGTPMLLA
jgi:hypothetical protein